MLDPAWSGAPTGPAATERGPQPDAPRSALDPNQPAAAAVVGALVVAAADLDALGACPTDEVAEAVHAMRRCVRRICALVRLVAPAIVGDLAARRALKDLAAAARIVSRARDAQVIPDAWRALPLPVQQQTAAIGAMLDRARLAMHEEGGASTDLIRAAAAAAAATRSFARQLPPVLPSNVWREGLRLALARVHAARKHARRRPRPQAIHELRKACKDVRHQIEWLGGDATDAVLSALVDSIRSLGALTDLLALDEWLRGGGRACPAAERAVIREALDKQLRKATDRQIARCRDLLGGKPKKVAAALLADLAPPSSS